MSRKGFIRFNGKSMSLFSASLEFSAASNAGMTFPRLTVSRPSHWGWECQLIRPNVMPASLTPIHVPLPGSDGYNAITFSCRKYAGGSAAIREICSSRFIARSKPSLLGRKETEHMGRRSFQEQRFAIGELCQWRLQNCHYLACWSSHWINLQSDGRDCSFDSVSIQKRS